MSFAELVPVWAWPRRQTLYVPRDADRQAFRGAGDMKTRAAVLGATGAPAPYETSKPLGVEELVLDPPGPGEVLVRIKAAGLCQSDLSVINGDRPRPLPMALGHEAAGIVEEVGSGVDALARGDHVVCVFVPSCGHCGPCAEGRPALCEPGAAVNGAGTLLSGARRLHRPDGTPVQHHLGVSGLADYATVWRRSLVRIDPELPLTEAALFGCAVLTGVGAVVNTARLQAGASVAVVGLGGVGLCSLLGAIAAGAREVVTVDLADDKLAFARQLGATATFDSKDPDCAEQVRSATGGGVEYAFELAGAVKALELAYKITRRGGATGTAALPPPPAPCRRSTWWPRSGRSRAATSAPPFRAGTSRASSSSTGAADCPSTG